MSEEAQGESYSNWVRSALRATAGDPEALVLFDSTIPEPTDLLAGVVRRAFAGPVTDRYESVFADGNRFVAQAVADRYGVGAERVLTTTGATSATAMVLRAYVAPGDHVIVETPCFDLLPNLAREAGAQVSFLARRAPDFGIDVGELAAMIRPNTRLVMLTDLHNPSGTRLDDAALMDIADLSSRTRAPVLVDEVYGDFAEPRRAAAALRPEFITVGSLTKIQGLFALKCGWAIASPDKLEQILAAHPNGDRGVSKLAHAVAALVLEDIEPFEAHWRSLLAEARPVLERHAAAMIADGLLVGAPPPCGNMYFPQVTGVSDTLALSDRLWRDHRLVVAPGEFFGSPGHIRLGFGGRAEALDRGLSRLHAALAGMGGR